jgi:hypothetical protein
MHVEAIFVGYGQRQIFQKLTLMCSKLVPGPLNRSLRLRVHGVARIGKRIVVIAANGYRALVDQIHDSGDTPFRIGAVADIIAEQNGRRGAAVVGVRQTGGKGFAIGVDIGKNRNPHGFNLD